MAKRFVEESEVKRLDLGEGDWVEIPARFSFDAAEKLAALGAEKGGKDIGFLLQVIKKWNFKDGDEVAPITEATVRKLDVETIKAISEAVMAVFGVEKKSSPTSAGPS